MGKGDWHPPGAGRRAKEVWRATPRLGGQPATVRVRGVYRTTTGRLPQDVYEHQLIPLFQRVGRLYEFRLMMTFSGLNRGFAYARYSSRRGAQTAIATLHNHQLRPSCQLLVCRSAKKCELTVDRLPLSLNRCVTARPTTARSLPATKPWVCAPLKLHCSSLALTRTAAMVKRALVEGQSRLCGEQVAVEWLKPDLKHHFRQQLAGPSL